MHRERRGRLLAALEKGWRDHAAAVHQRTDRHCGLKRRDREPVAKRDRDGVELAPALGHQRLGALGQLGAQPIELTEFFEERLMVLDAERERHAGGADIRRIGEDLRHRQHAVLRMVIVDVELAVTQRTARVERRGQ